MSTSSSKSSSSSSTSSLSSSSSYFSPYYDVPFYVEIAEENPVWSFAKYKDTFYAGTGPHGQIKMSKNGETWDVFRTIDDAHAVKLFVWQDALFIGTSPNGTIYVYNFETGRFYPWVLTDDQTVTSFAAYQDNLYAGTSPNGYVYKLTGTTWSKKFKIAGNGITDMSANDQGLFIFSTGIVSPIVYDGEKLSLINIDSKPLIASFSQPKTGVIDIPQTTDEEGETLSSSSSTSGFSPEPKTGENRHSVASNINEQVEIFSFENGYFVNRAKVLNLDALLTQGTLQEAEGYYIQPPNPEYLITQGAVGKTGDDGLYFSGKNLYAYDGSSLNTIAQGKGKPVERFVLADGFVFYTIDNTVFVSQLPGEVK